MCVCVCFCKSYDRGVSLFNDLLMINIYASHTSM